MNERVKKLWIKALRSGKYPQGFRRLQDAGGGYCCFGVLEHIAADEGVVPQFNGNRNYCSDTVVKWAELPSFNPQVPTAEDESRSDYLANLNDHGHDFSYIADRIERYL